jgi:hypothetical protein
VCLGRKAGARDASWHFTASATARSSIGACTSPSARLCRQQQHQQPQRHQPAVCSTFQFAGAQYLLTRYPYEQVDHTQHSVTQSRRGEYGEIAGHRCCSYVADAEAALGHRCWPSGCVCCLLMLVLNCNKFCGCLSSGFGGLCVFTLSDCRKMLPIMCRHVSTLQSSPRTPVPNHGGFLCRVLKAQSACSKRVVPRNPTTKP